MLIAKMPIAQIAEASLSSYLTTMARQKTIDTQRVTDEDDKVLPTWCTTADVWIGCCEAWPHRDPDWKGQYFLTLCILGDHEVCDERTDGPIPVTPGDLFVVDPMCRHWLMPRDHRNIDPPRPFLAVQWEVPKRKCAEAARQLVAAGEGIWENSPSAMGRYLAWRPEPSIGG